MADQNESEKQGVLLYYKYTSSPIDDLNQLFTFYNSICSSLGLLGRVRLAPQGVNVTIGGKLYFLHSHIASLLDSYGGLFEGTDFKLASCDEPLSMEVAKECGFTSLSIRIVKELVTLSSNPLVKTPSISNAGMHLSALQFHSVLQNAGEPLKEESQIDFERLVLLDARNLYETRIGKFESPEVETLDPTTRQYSDLPAWIDSNAEKLRGNCVLMYCTGGIRCEMASAYIRSKGAGFENVFQLFGGIQRYLEQFPDGGFFKGKNFVYDHRISVGSSNQYIMGKCLHCGNSFDDYSSRCRCAFCRMLVLVCNNCQHENAQYVCELCQKYGKVAQSVPSADYSSEAIQECDVGAAPTDSLPHFSTRNLPIPCSPAKKYAWLVAPDFHRKKLIDWERTDKSFDPLQYQQQTEGFSASLSYLRTIVSKEGPFNGILGFSQGAAMAALVCAQRERLDLELGFRFVILCSGFAINLAGYEEGSINCPSLHVFGNKKVGDRQISDCSRSLASYFEEGCRKIIEHDSGHIIPPRPPYIDEVKEFLQRFM